MRVNFDEEDISFISQKIIEAIRPLLDKSELSGDDVIYDVKGISEYLKVDTSWIYKATSLKEIPHIKLGKYTRFKKSVIDEWLKSQTIRPVAPIVGLKRFKNNS